MCAMCSNRVLSDIDQDSLYTKISVQLANALSYLELEQVRT